MIEPLLSKVTGYFPKRDRTCLKNVLILSMCILMKETVCLNKLKSSVGLVTEKENIQPNSHYKRLIRIFDKFAYSSLWLELLKFVFQLLRLKSDYLLMDGTSWKRGEKWYHYLTLCVVYKEVAIPIYWEDLDKHGTSNFKERKRVIRKAQRHFNIENKTLIADREYIGTKWFNFLIINNIDFVIRLKHKTYKEAINQSKGRSYNQMIQKVMASKIPDKALSKFFKLEGMLLNFVVVKNPKKNAREKVLFLITNIQKPASQIVRIYPIRWKIEHCFKHLKSNGFQLEFINLKGSARTTLLMAIMVFAYVLSIHEGLRGYKQVPMKKYKDGSQTKEVSVFRNGIDKMGEYLWSFYEFCLYIITQIDQAIRMYKSPFSINV